MRVAIRELSRFRTGFVGVTCAALAMCALAACGLRNAAPVRSFEVATQGVYTGALSGDSELSLIGSMNHGASLWRVADQERLYNWNHKTGEFSQLVAAAFSPDGKRAVTTDPRTLVLWDTATGKALAFWTTPSAALDVAIDTDGRTVLIGQQDHSAVLFDAESGDYLHTMLHEGKVVSVDISRDGSMAITASEDHTAKVWDMTTGEDVATLDHSNPVRVAAISASGRFALTASQGQLVGLWNARTGHLLHTLSARNAGVTTARFDADEALLLIGYVNRRVELWDANQGNLLAAWLVSTKNRWQRRAAVVAVGFGAYAGTYYALSGDGQLVELRRS